VGLRRGCPVLSPLSGERNPTNIIPQPTHGPASLCGQDPWIIATNGKLPAMSTMALLQSCNSSAHKKSRPACLSPLSLQPLGILHPKTPQNLHEGKLSDGQERGFVEKLSGYYKVLWS